MATYVLIHGAGDVGWYWHLVERELRTRGHDVVVMDLPVDDDAATLSDYANVVVEAIGDRREDLIVVAQSYGGYVAPIVCDRVPARLMVLVAAMIPSPRESAEQMFANTRFDDAVRPKTDDTGELAIFYHDVPRPLAEEALSRGRPQSDTTAAEPFPLAAWPDVPTAVILCRQDRLFPAAWLRQVVRQRLGTAPEEIDSGHTPALSHPVELTNLLERIRVDTLDTGTAECPIVDARAAEVLEHGCVADKTMPSYTARPLDVDTWDDFARLVEANNGVWGGCWCMGFHPEGVGEDRTAAQNREAKHAHVRNGTAHQVLVYDGDECVGWCQYGAPADLPNIKNPRAYDQGANELPDWRIGCIFTGKGHRREGVARAAVAAALAAIEEAGGGLVEAYPEQVEGREPQRGAYFHTGPENLFEEFGFKRDRRIAKWRWVMQRRVQRR